jgi:hypothetical protein
LTSALDVSEWSASRPDRFTPREKAPCLVHVYTIVNCFSAAWTIFFPGIFSKINYCRINNYKQIKFKKCSLKIRVLRRILEPKREEVAEAREDCIRKSFVTSKLHHILLG